MNKQKEVEKFYKEEDKRLKDKLPKIKKETKKVFDDKLMKVITVSKKELEKVKKLGRTHHIITPEALVEICIHDNKVYLTNFIELKKDAGVIDKLKSQGEKIIRNRSEQLIKDAEYMINIRKPKVEEGIRGYQPDKIFIDDKLPPTEGSGLITEKHKDNFNTEDDMIRDWSDMIFEFDKAEKIIALSPAQLELRTFAKSKLNELLLIKKDREKMEMNKAQPDKIMNFFMRIQELLLENGYPTNFMAFLRDDFYISIFKNNIVNKLCSAYGDVEIMKVTNATDLITISI